MGQVLVLAFLPFGQKSRNNHHSVFNILTVIASIRVSKRVVEWEIFLDLGVKWDMVFL